MWIKDSTSGRNDTDVTQTFDADEVYGIALNMDDNQISFYQDGSLITNGGSIALDGLADKYVFPFASNYNSQSESWAPNGVNCSVSIITTGQKYNEWKDTIKYFGYSKFKRCSYF